MANIYDGFSEEELIKKLNRGFLGEDDLSDIVSAMQAKGMSGRLMQVDDNDPLAEKVAKEYIDFHKKIQDGKSTVKDLKEAIKQLPRKDLSDNKIKEIIITLAHSGNVKALRALEKYSKKAEGELKKWSKMAIDECKMFLESELTGKASIKVSGTSQDTPKKISKFSRLLDFFFSDDAEIQRAISEYADGKLDRYGRLEFYNEQDEDLFMDWIVFDYHFPNGKKLIENFLEAKEKELSKAERSEFEEMTLNKYGLFEVKKIMPEEWIDLESISTGKVYRVKEKLGTRGSRVGRCLIGRLGKEKGLWRIIGSNPIEVPLQFAKSAKELFVKANFTPKDFRNLAAKIIPS
jgi:hypothetical protein